jgi:signal peptidase I
MEDSLSTNPQNETPKEKKQGSFFMEIVKFTIIAVIIVVPFRLFIAQPFIVSGASMDPTFENGEYLIVDQITYRLEKPQRESIIIFKYPKDTSKFFIKRIIGLPGETVEISGTKVKIKNNKHPEGIILDEPYVAINHEKQDKMTVILKDNEYFVMGDNRIGSSDSRIWGPVDEKLITGRPILRLLPLKKIDFFPGREEAQN